MIEFIIANWLLFLIISLAGFTIAISIQLLNLKMLWNGDGIEDGGIFKRLGFAVVFGLAGIASGIVFVTSVVLNAIEYFSS